MKTIKYIFFLLALGITACDNFLNVAPDVNLNEDKVFTNFVNAQAFQADINSGLTQRFNAIGSYLPVPMSSAADESESNADCIFTTLIQFKVQADWLQCQMLRSQKLHSR